MIALIAEKPSVAKDIARIIGATGRNDGYLSGNGYMVTWAFGHLIQLAMPEAYGVANFRRESLPILCLLYTSRNYGCPNKHGRQYVRRTGIQPKQSGQRGSKGAFLQPDAVKRRCV